LSRPPAALDLLTEQPGPRTHGHGVGPTTRPDAGWVLARPLRQPRPGTTTRPSQASAKGPSPLPMIRRRSSASSSFVLAAARLRALQDTSHTTTRTRQPRGRSRRTVRPARRHHASHRVKFLCPLDTSGPHGCRNPRSGLSQISWRTCRASPNGGQARGARRSAVLLSEHGLAWHLMPPGSQSCAWVGLGVSSLELRW
jgi:hypothetical protein